MTYRVLAESHDGRPLLRQEFADRVSAQTFRTQLEYLTTTPTRLQVKSADGWKDEETNP